MPTFAYVTADVFTRERFGGNQLAVFPNASGIPEPMLPRIAREFNFSETTYVFPAASAAHTRRVRIFTPGGELPFAGHPTVGTAVALAELGEIVLTGHEANIIFEELVGPVHVLIRASPGEPGFAQLTAAQLPEFGPPPPPPPDIARMLGLQPNDLLDGALAPESVSCGVPFLLVPVRDRAALGRARVIGDEFDRVLSSYWTANVFVFCDDPEREGSDYRARMFSPGIGVIEDPATGSAAVAFGGYLAKRNPIADGTLRWRIEQGFEMGRPSLLDVEVDKRSGGTVALRVGGYSVLVTRGEFFL